MSGEATLAIAAGLIERGWVPDPLVRWGIRRLCAERLADERSALGGDDPAAVVRRFVDALAGAEIAPVPEAANRQHYEVPAECFERMLGPQLKYSCCYWDDPDAPLTALAEAEESALALTAARAGVEDGMRVLELGCGWGSLTLWLASRFPRAQITAVSNSAGQRRFIDGRAQESGLRNVTVLTADMNVLDLAERFDRIVSVEMFEHMRNYQALLAKVHRWLRPDGRLFVHIFCHRRFAYTFETEGAGNWMGRHFFTGGLMPSADLLPMVPSPFTLEERWLWDGTHYQRTADAWLARLDVHRAEMLEIFARLYGRAAAAVWFERWRMFLMACSELFGYRRGTEWGVAHYRFAPVE